MTEIEPDKAGAPPSPRALNVIAVVNGTVLAIIALAVLAQCIGFGIRLFGATEKTDPGWLAVFGYLSIAIIPGVLLAFVKFLLNVIRSFKDSKARPRAAGYLLVTLWPLILLMFISAGSIGTRNDPVPGREPESEQFLAGRDWAREKQPVSGSACRGSSEFNRGCRSVIAERRRAQFLAGRDWAKANTPARASACQGDSLHFISGCRNYFFEHLAQPKPAGQGRYEGMTTAECKTEVNANYELSTRLDLEDGNTHAAQSTTRRHWIPDLADCENYDKLADNTFMPKAYDRLQRLLDKLKSDQAVSEDEKAVMLKDFGDMAMLRDQPYKTAYFNLADEAIARMSPGYKNPTTYFPKISCEEYQAKIDETGNLDRQRVAAMQALKRPDGVVVDSARHDDLNRQRIAALWDWKFYTDGAKAAGCEIKLK